MKEGPILMSGPMVGATLEGRKTKTRRTAGLDVINRNPNSWSSDVEPFVGETLWIGFSSNAGEDAVKCPYGKPGERLWVREAHYLWGWWAKIDGKHRFLYERSYGVRFEAPPTVLTGRSKRRGWYKRPSIFMPRWASRISLEITEIRVERLQEISEEDAKAEGMDNNHSIKWPDGDPGYIDDVYRRNFATGWNSLNAKRGFGWDKNPWVWVIGFRRIDG